MPRFVPLGIKKAQAARLALLGRAAEFGVEAGPDRLGPFSISWSSRNGGTGEVKFRNLLVAKVISARDGLRLSVRDEIPERADGVISRAVLNAVEVCDEIGRVRRNQRPEEPDDYCARITAKESYDLGDWTARDAHLALLGLADLRPGEAFIGPANWGNHADSLVVLGAKPVSAFLANRQGQPLRVHSWRGGRVIAVPFMREMLAQGRDRVEAAWAGPGDAFEGLADAARADDVSISLLWASSALGQPAQPGGRTPIRRDFGPFSVSMNESGFITHAHAGVVYAWGGGGSRFTTDPHAANEARASMGLPLIHDELLRLGLRAGAAALLGEELRSFSLADENEINDEALRLGF